MPPRYRAIALMGPTASGKTALALALAQRFSVEIISVDSALVYRDMNIGTAKPSRDDRRACPHHLIDMISPLESYSVARFCLDAHQAIANIQSRGRIPLLVGGTMLYFKALQQGLSPLPRANPALRSQLDKEAATLGWPTMHARLTTLDPDTAARLSPTDSHRIQRALEVYLLTGTPISKLVAQCRNNNPDLSVLPLVLVPAERQWLHHRIEHRFKWMLEQGLLDELSQLRQTYPTLSRQLPSMRCVGYRQAWEYQQGLYGYDHLIAKGVAATRQLAKRQLTWIRSLKESVAINAQSTTVRNDLIQAAAAWLGCSSTH